MPAYANPTCSVCGNYCSPELLTVKFIGFKNLTKSRWIKQRVTQWLCRTCRDKDPDWYRESHSGPGHTSAPLEEVREAKRANPLATRPPEAT